MPARNFRESSITSGRVPLGAPGHFRIASRMYSFGILGLPGCDNDMNMLVSFEEGLSISPACTGAILQSPARTSYERAQPRGLFLRQLCQVMDVTPALNYDRA